MKKLVKTLFVAFVTLGFFASCNLGSGKSGDGSSMNDKSVNSGDDANDIIAFYNKLIELDDRQSSYMEGYAKYLDQFQLFVESVKKKDFGYSFDVTPPLNFIPYEVKTLKVPNVLGKEYTELTKEMTDSYDELIKLNDELQLYRKGRDFKDDGGEKLLAFHKNANEIIAKNRKASVAIFEKISDKIDEAENEVLKNHPLKKQILNSREALNLSQEIANVAYASPDVESFLMNMEEYYAKLEKISERNSKTKFSGNSNYANKETSYNKFNKEIEEFLAELRSVQRTIKEKNELMEFELEKIDRKVELVRNQYNRFVQ